MLHRQLIALHGSLGYFPSKEGVCVLYAEKGIDGWLLGPEEFKRFQARNKIIEKHSATITSHLQRVKDKLKSAPLTKPGDCKNPAEKKLTKDDLFVFEVAAYMEQGELYLQPELYSEVFNKPLSQSHLNEVAPFAQPQLMEDEKQGGGRHQLLHTIGLYDEKELIEYLTHLNNFAIDAKVNFAVSLGSDNHGIGLGYDAKQKSWQLIDVRNPDCKPISGDMRKLAEAVRKAFSDQPKPTSFFKELFASSEPLVTGFSARVFCRKSHEGRLSKLIDKLKTSNQFKALHMLTPKRITRKNKRGINLAWLYAKEGDDVSLRSLLTFRNPWLDLNQGENTSGETPAWMAAQGGHVAVLQILIDLKNADGSPRVALNQANKYDHTPVFVAAQNGHVVALQALISAKNVDGSLRVDINKASVIGATPAYAAAENNNVTSLKLLAENGADLSLKCRNKTPRQISEEKGNHAVVKFFKAWDVRCQLLADITQKHGAAGKYRIDSVKKYFHDNHERFLEKDFLQSLRQKLIETTVQWHPNKASMFCAGVGGVVNSPVYSAARLKNIR